MHIKRKKMYIVPTLEIRVYVSVCVCVLPKLV